MIDFVKLYTIEQGDQNVLYKKVLYSKPCEPNTVQSQDAFAEMMRLISSNREIYQCGPMWPEDLTVKHDGQKWIFTFRALYVQKNVSQTG